MTEMMGSIESDEGLTSNAEGVRESLEKFKENYRRAQAEIARIRQEESRKKRDDNTLAGIIVKLLSDPKYARFFVLICTLTGKNIPSDIILSIVALIYTPAQNMIEREYAPKEQNFKKPKPAKISPAHNRHIDTWVHNIFLVASLESERLTQTAFDVGECTDPDLIEFSTLVLQEFLEVLKKEQVLHKQISHFCARFWQDILQQFKVHTEYRKLFTPKVC